MSIQPTGDRIPLIAVHGWAGTLYHYVDMARALAPHRPVLGLQPAGFADPASCPGIEVMAAAYADSITERIPHGPIHLVGYSVGGWYASAVAAALIERGRQIGLLAMFDCHADGAKVNVWLRMRLLPFSIPVLLEENYQRFKRQSGGGRLAWLGNRVGARVRRALGRAGRAPATDDPYADPYVKLARQTYRPPRLPVVVDLFGPPRSMRLQRMTWQYYARGGVRSHPMLETHEDFLRADVGPQLAFAVESALAAIEQSSGPTPA